MTANPTTWREVLASSEKLSVLDQLRLITELSLRLRQVLDESKPLDLLTLAGIGKEVWTNLDVDTYLNEERDSWSA
jgi:hypothetical protein